MCSSLGLGEFIKIISYNQIQVLMWTGIERERVRERVRERERGETEKCRERGKRKGRLRGL
jgi:hypothetical protein